MRLRDYQQEAVDSVFDFWARAPAGSNPLIEAPTGAGKSLIIAALSLKLVELGARVCIVAHRAELIKQNTNAILRLDPSAPVAQWSASLNEKDVSKITLCGIQTAAKDPGFLGRIDVVIIDEAHLIPTESDSLYRAFIDRLSHQNSDLRAVGLTATPYRLDQGLLTDGESPLFTAICHSIEIKTLIDQGVLVEPVPCGVSREIDMEMVEQKAKGSGEYRLSDYESETLDPQLTAAVASDIYEMISAGKARSAIVFGSNQQHCRDLMIAIGSKAVPCAVILGDTPQEARQSIFEEARQGRIRCLISCGVLTTGFDLPVIDLVALVRPTKSVSLYVQMIGRGLRQSPGKTVCHVLDYGGNVKRHGPIDEVRIRPRGTSGGDAPTKICPSCCAKQPASMRQCQYCGFSFPKPVSKLEYRPSELAILSKQYGTTSEDLGIHPVDYVEFSAHRKLSKDADDPTAITLRATYHTQEAGQVSQWICFNHTGFARSKAEAWWRAIGKTGEPGTVSEVLEDLSSDPPHIVSITTKPSKDGSKYREVIALDLGEGKKESRKEETNKWIDDDDPLPF